MHDVHDTPPADCDWCAFMPNPASACLTHTCIDCGSITYRETNERGELTHECPA